RRGRDRRGRAPSGRFLRSRASCSFGGASAMSPKQLSMEDRILWGKVARTTAPLPGRTLDEPDLEQESFEQMLEVSVKPRRKAADAAPQPSQPAIPEKAAAPRQHPIEKPTRQ